MASPAEGEDTAVVARKKPAVGASKVTLSQVVESNLRDLILGGRIAPGTQMNEVELSTRYSTSRGPIREALQRLVQEGLLIASPHRGVFVPIVTDADLEDLHFARAVLEQAAMRTILERGAPAALMVDLYRILDVMERELVADDWEGVAVCDLDFHAAVVAGAGSAQLRRMYATLEAQTRLGLNLLFHSYRERRSELLDEHRRLAQYLATGDKRVGEELARHFAMAPPAPRRSLSSAPDPAPRTSCPDVRGAGSITR